MGKIKRGILGGFEGKVGNVIGGSWKGIAYMRAQPLSVANPRTPAQQEQRGAFGNCVDVARQLLTAIIRVYWNQYAGAMSGYNLFVSRNIEAFNQTDMDTPPVFSICIGPIQSAPVGPLLIDTGNNEVNVNWTDNSGQGNAQPTDQAIVAAYNHRTGYISYTDNGTQRDTPGVTVALPEIQAGDQISAWVSFKNSEDETGESESITDTA